LAEGSKVQVTKGVWWMSWHLEAMKGVVGCVKRRIGANNLQPGDTRMGKPIPLKGGICSASGRGSQPGEVKHLSTLRKRYSESSGERNRNSPNRAACSSGYTLCSRCSGVQLNPNTLRIVKLQRLGIVKASWKGAP